MTRKGCEEEANLDQALARGREGKGGIENAWDWEGGGEVTRSIGKSAGLEKVAQSCARGVNGNREGEDPQEGGQLIGVLCIARKKVKAEAEGGSGVQHRMIPW